MIGALSISAWPGDWGHGICGPWGCGPPLQALIACHLAWLVALAPIAQWLVHSTRVSNRMLRSIGQLAAGAALAGLAVVLAHQYFVWWPQTSEFQRPYFWQRYAFTIATMVDVPFVQLLVFGIATAAARSKRSRLATYENVRRPSEPACRFAQSDIEMELQNGA
ncbi:MAG: hypothetical protein AB7U20_25160 [Planctomycetaceae bacterium]